MCVCVCVSQVGTLNYMSPEAIQGGANNPLGLPSQKVGRPSDVWSLGCILYQVRECVLCVRARVCVHTRLHKASYNT